MHFGPSLKDMGSMLGSEWRNNPRIYGKNKWFDHSILYGSAAKQVFLCENRVHKIMEWLAFYLFVSINNARKKPDDASDTGQCITHSSCDCY